MKRAFPMSSGSTGASTTAVVWGVLYEMDSIKVSMHFPRKVAIRSKRALALTLPLKVTNVLETEA